jgi:DNA repair protein RecO (recombination protein O)
MQETYGTKAIILGRRPFRECDTMVSVFCLDNGKLELVARGTKKPNSKLAGHIEPISLSNIMIARGRQYDYLAAAVNENSFVNIKNDFDKLSIAGRAVGVFEKLVKENEKDNNLFNLLFSFLNILNSCKLKVVSCKLLFNFFILKFISELGYKPEELYNCVVCKKKIIPNNNKFDLTKGGVVCGQCAPAPSHSPSPASRERGARLTITDNCIKVLRMAVGIDLDKLLKLKIEKKLEKEVEKIIWSFYQYNF